MHGHVQGLIREVFDARVIPAVELASRNMMTQINASFQAGTTECKFSFVLVVCLHLAFVSDFCVCDLVFIV